MSAVRRNSDSVAKTPTAPASVTLYNTAVRSSLNPRPVMLRVPLRTPSRHEARDGDADDDASFLHAAEPQTGRALTMDRSSGKKTLRSGDGREGASLNFDRTSPSLMSPAPLPLWPPASEASAAPVPAGCPARAPSSPPAAPRRSTSAVLVSPRPSPPSKGSVAAERPAGHVSPFAKVLPAASKVRRRTGGKGGSAEVRNFLQAVPPRPRITTPLQHLLVYNNEAQRQSEGSAVGNADLARQGSRTPSCSVAASASSLADEAQLRSTFTGGGGGDLRSQLDPCRTSTTSLQFSLPRDEKSSSSTDSTLAAQIPFRNTRRRRQGGRMSPFSNRRVVFSLALENEDSSTSDEDIRNGIGKATPRPALRPYSVPVCRTARATCDPADNARASPTLHTSTAEPVRRPRSATPAKAEIMRAYHALQLQKETLVLMDYEEKERREITTAYVHATRGILVNHTFQRSLLLTREEETLPSHSPPCKGASSSLESETKKRKALLKKEGNTTSTTTTTTKAAGSKRAASPQQSFIARTPGLRPVQSTQHRCVAVADDKSARENLAPSSFQGSSHARQIERRDKGLTSTESAVGTRHIVCPSISSGTESTLLLEVSENMSQIPYAMRLVEGRLLRFFSAEPSARQCVVEEEAQAFHFLLRYHRLCENAFQPSVIYLQEACQWQSVLTEAKNDFYRLQEARLDWELQQSIEFARACAQNVAALVEAENHIRCMRIQESEDEEYRQLVRIFRSGLAALVELEMCNQRRQLREREEKMETVVVQEMREREEVWTAELRRRGTLYGRFEAESHIRASCLWDAPPPAHGSREGAAVDASIELSAIAGVHDDDHSCASHAEALSAAPLAGATSTAKTPSTIQSVNSIAAQLLALSAAEYDATREATWSRGAKQVVHAEREFFEWNPTSNTLPTTTNNTTTGTTTLVVGGDLHSGHNTSAGAQGKRQRPSSPQLCGIPCTSTTACSGFSSQHDASTAAEAAGVGQTQRDETCGNAPAAVYDGGADASVEVLDVTADSSGMHVSVQSNPSCKALRRDVGVSVNLWTPDPSRGGGERHTAPRNRHIVPCSLRRHRPYDEQRDDATPLSQRHGSGGRPHMTSCGTQLTPPTRRPYRDDVIFELAPRKPSATATNREGSPAEAVAGLRKEFSNGPVRTSSSSAAAPSRGKEVLREKDPQEYETGLGGGGAEDLERLEVLEGMEDWSQTPDEAEADASTGVAEALLDEGSPSLHTPSTAYSTTADLGTREERSGALSAEHTRREGDTVPECSLSTMLDATAAVSVDPYEVGAQRLRQNPATTAEEVTSLSSPSSYTRSMSQSTGFNKLSARNSHDGHCTHDGKMPDAASYASPTGVGGNVFRETGKDAVVFYYPPFNYMRPTMSWRRQHEGLEWPTKPFTSPARSRSVRSNRSGQAGRQRRWKESTPAQVTRVPFEEGPGVWGDVELPRRPFGYDASGSRAYAVTNAVSHSMPVATTIASPRQRRDAACRFMADGSASRSPSHARGSVPCRTSESPTAAKANAESVEKKLRSFSTIRRPWRILVESYSGGLSRHAKPVRPRTFTRHLILHGCGRRRLPTWRPFTSLTARWQGESASLRPCVVVRRCWSCLGPQRRRPHIASTNNIIADAAVMGTLVAVSWRSPQGLPAATLRVRHGAPNRNHGTEAVHTHTHTHVYVHIYIYIHTYNEDA
ncbi:uncharacterized protein Tco025E_00765 [Trypanosoma conorhini]|uniref:Uncharacterized protein n=1 Tax=Trypanosoma conorhini TaxID=83891 RepID=A0A3R7P0U0_9TRYP|nr:uncharacterized protein Tco025E_00765 [Trypanosoma conorhini]RNF27009.1 hypothetical protein Tco025E_00765 [Trypanosoma conorhini]